VARAEVATIQTTIVADFARVLRVDEILDVIKAEGLANGDELAADMFAGNAGADWSAAVARVYDTAAMRRNFDLSLSRLSEADAAALAESLTFYTSDLGQRIIGLELEARRAMLDPAVEEAAIADWKALSDQDRIDQLDRFAAINDLVESNVMGALNANLAYYRGMSGAGAFGKPMPEDQMLSEVWSQEDDLRKETVDWLFPYISLAYSPLSRDELQAYIDFSDTPAGRRANAVLFAAFDAVFVVVSADLGQAVALRLNGQDI
jgi:hypothetical protein